VYKKRMAAKQQAWHRFDPDDRREALVEACIRTLARRGAHGVSVRTICTEAGVSPGLLRHYFAGIDALIAQAYQTTGERVSNALEAAVACGHPGDPQSRLIAYLTASFSPPVADPDVLATWLAFWGLIRTDPAITALHAKLYADYRQRLETLLAPCLPEGRDLRTSAIGLTALVDGLWLELSLGDAVFSPDEASGIVQSWLALICK
jgi:TetR/AcrR family transcriptional repressor of bet genes